MIGCIRIRQCEPPSVYSRDTGVRWSRWSSCSYDSTKVDGQVHSGPLFGCSGTQCRESQRNRTCEPAVARRGRRRNARRPFLLVCLESVRDSGLVRLRLSTNSGCCGMPVPLAPRPPGSRTMHRDKKPCSPRRGHRHLQQVSTRGRLEPLYRPTGQTRQQAQSTIRGHGCWSHGWRTLILDRLISKLFPVRNLNSASPVKSRSALRALFPETLVTVVWGAARYCTPVARDDRYRCVS